jgi:hypothetical protein
MSFLERGELRQTTDKHGCAVELSRRRQILLVRSGFEQTRMNAGAHLLPKRRMQEETHRAGRCKRRTGTRRSAGREAKGGTAKNHPTDGLGDVGPMNAKNIGRLTFRSSGRVRDGKTENFVFIVTRSSKAVHSDQLENAASTETSASEIVDSKRTRVSGSLLSAIRIT